MMFIQEFYLVIISVTISVSTSSLINYINNKQKENKMLKRAKRNVILFAKFLQIAIANNQTELEEAVSETVLESYSLFSDDQRMVKIIDRLLAYYKFLKAGGYSANEHKRGEDIIEIDKLIEAARYDDK